MVSSLLSNDREKWSGSHYMAAKYYADKILEASSLDYTEKNRLGYEELAENSA